MDTGGRAISPCLRFLLNLTTLVYALCFGIPSMAITAALCVVLPCCSIPAFRMSSEGPFVTFMTLSSIVASLVLMLGLCLLAAPVVLPLLIVVSVFKGVRYCYYRGAVPADEVAAATASAAGEPAPAPVPAPAAQAAAASAALSPPPPASARAVHLTSAGDVYVSLSTPPRTAPLGAAAAAAAAATAAAAAGQEVEVRLTFAE